MKLRLLTLLAALVLSACSSIEPEAPKTELGDFALGHNIVVAPAPHKGPGSRDATDEELIAAVRNAIAERFEPYEGEKLYNLGISVDGYALGEAGVPIVLAPKSALIIHVTIWDDAAGAKLNDEPFQIAVVEDINAQSIFGSGFFSSSDQQLAAVAKKAAEKVEEWFLDNPEWFGLDG